MRELIEQLLDIIFPPRCVICKKIGRSAICDECLKKAAHLSPPICVICGKMRDRYFKGDFCEDCVKGDVPFDVARSAIVYDGAMKDAIHKFKFEGKRKLSSLLGRFMIEYLEKGDIPLSNIDAVIPLPLSAKRERQRGYNQSKLLAGEISRRFSIDLDSSALKKIKDVKPQFELSRAERLLNVKGAFSSSPVSGKNILLIDDIYTTGATVRDASRALREAGAGKVYVLTLARAVDHEAK